MERIALVVDQDRRLFGQIRQAVLDEDFDGRLVLGDCEASRIRQYDPSLVVIADSCLGLDPRRFLGRLIAEVPSPFMVICSSRDTATDTSGSAVDAGIALNLGALDSVYRGDAIEVVRARTRRACQLTRVLYPAPGLISVIGDLQLNVARRQLILADRVLQLGHIEARLVSALARAKGDLISRADLFEFAWRDHLEPNDRRLDVRLSAINYKLHQLTKGQVRISCVRNSGYRMIECGSVA